MTLEPEALDSSAGGDHGTDSPVTSRHSGLGKCVDAYPSDGLAEAAGEAARGLWLDGQLPLVLVVPPVMSGKHGRRCQLTSYLILYMIVHCICKSDNVPRAQPTERQFQACRLLQQLPTAMPWDYLPPVDTYSKYNIGIAIAKSCSKKYFLKRGLDILTGGTPCVGRC